MGLGYFAYALQWYLRKQGKFDGASIRTRQKDDGSFELFEWKVEGMEKPTENEIKSIMVQYHDAGRPLDKKNDN